MILEIFPFLLKLPVKLAENLLATEAFFLLPLQLSDLSSLSLLPLQLSEHLLKPSPLRVTHRLKKKKTRRIRKIRGELEKDVEN